MYNWFECKVSYDRMGDEGLLTSVKESYLVDALSFTEAEKRITKEIQPFVSGEFMVANIRRMKLADLFTRPGGDRWYRCKVNMITIDEEKDLERKQALQMMVQATNFSEAVQLLSEELKKSIADCEIVSIIETNLMDVFQYEPAEKEAE